MSLQRHADELVSLLQRAAGKVDTHGHLHSPDDGKFIGKTGGSLDDVVEGAREVMTAGRRVGDADMADRLATAHADPYGDPQMFGFEHVGSGSQRDVWLDGDAYPPVVYKIGDDDANRSEVRNLARLRKESVDYAPDATLYEVDVDATDPYDDGGRRTVTVVAMPYLPEDGSVPHAGVVLPGAGDLNPANVVSNGGKLWLIDAGGM